MAVWRSQIYSSGDFTASGAATWTVDVADVRLFSYAIFGKTMIVSVEIVTTSVTRSGGDPTQLKIKIPAGKSAAARTWTFPIWYNDNGTKSEGVAQIVGGSTPTIINCFLLGAGQWATSTDNTYIRFQAIFEIQ